MVNCSALGFLLLCLVAAPLSIASAQTDPAASLIGFDSSVLPAYQPLNFYWYPTIGFEMKTYSDVGGTNQTDSYFCTISSSCAPGRNGQPAPFYHVELVGLAGTNVEVIGATCGGPNPAAGAGIRDCDNGPLRVSLRVKTGRGLINHVGADDLRIDTTGSDVFLWIDKPNNAFWQLGGNGHGTRVPVGTWQPELIPPPRGECHPVPDGTFTMEVTESTTTPTFQWHWTGTVCDFSVESQQGGGSVSNASGTITCNMPRGQFTKCQFTVPFGSDLVLTGTSDTYAPRFADNGGDCASSEPDYICRAHANADRALTISFDGAANPTQFNASAGANGPASRAALKGDVDVSVQQLHFTVNNSPAMTSLTINAAGTGAPATDIVAAKVFIDMNANGAVDSGDFQLGSGTFDSGGAAVVTFDEPYQQNTAFDLVIGVDFNSTIQAAVSIPFAPWSLLLIVALPVVLMRRRRGLVVGLGIALVTLATAVACGGGSSGGGGNGDDDQQQGDNGASDNDPTPDDDYVPPAGSKTYVFSVTAGTAQLSYLTTTAAPLNGLPLSGATISVQP